MTDYDCKKLGPPKTSVLHTLPSQTTHSTLSRSHDQPSVTGARGHVRNVSFMSWLSGPGDFSKSSTTSSVFCRICHDDEGCERLISPCRCSGSVAMVHRTCIEKWLSTANHDTCEICGQLFSISRHPRPFIQWLCEPAVGDDHRDLVGDLVCFLILTPIAIISAYLCGSGAAFYFQKKKSEALGLICLTSLLILIYVAWLLMSIRYHCQVWFKWRLNNQDIRLTDINVPSSKPTTPSRTSVITEDTLDPALAPMTSDLLPSTSPTPVVITSSSATTTDPDVTIILVSDSGVPDGQLKELSSSLSPSVMLPSFPVCSPSLCATNVSLTTSSVSSISNSEPLLTTFSITRSYTSPAPLSPMIVARNPLPQQNVIKCYEESYVYIPISPVNNNILSRSYVKPAVTHNVGFVPVLQQHIVNTRSRGLERRQEMSRGSFSPQSSSIGEHKAVAEIQDEELDQSSLQSRTHVKISEPTRDYDRATVPNASSFRVGIKPPVPPKSSTLSNHLNSYHNNKVLPTSRRLQECSMPETRHEQPKD